MRAAYPLAGLVLLAPAACLADAASQIRGGVNASTGEAVYQHVCQGCHMANAGGAVGAARIPALAGDKHLAAPLYPVAMVLHGNGGMPWFNGVLTDEQVAMVVNYVRSHFGNAYTDTVTVGEVKAMHGKPPTMEKG